MPHFANFPLLVEVNQVDRKLHEKSMDGLAGHDPQTGAWLQPFMLEQADTALFAGIRDLHSFAEDGIAGMIPHQYFQFC